MSRRTWLLAALLATLALYKFTQTLEANLYVDMCRSQGGSYDYEECRCDFENSHPAEGRGHVCND